MQLASAVTGAPHSTNFFFRQMAEEELLAPLMRLALVPHTLNYIAFRTLLLFTFTAKAIMKLASLGIVSAVMRTLRRPQEVLILFLFCGDANSASTSRGPVLALLVFDDWIVCVCVCVCVCAYIHIHIQIHTHTHTHTHTQVQCIRYSISTLHRVCTSSDCRTVEVLSRFRDEDALTLWKFVGVCVCVCVCVMCVCVFVCM
jgi:hypothetical protein